MTEIYIEKLKGGDYKLVDKDGRAVHLDGKPAYYPVFYTAEQAKTLPYPVLPKAEKVKR